MRVKFIDDLRCPHCGSDFKVEMVLERNNQDIITGVVQCECSKFPVLEGILDLNAGSLGSVIVDLLRERRIEEATIRCLAGHYSADYPIFNAGIPLFSQVLSVFISRLKKTWEKKGYAEVYTSFEKSSPLSSLLGNDTYETYLKQRFSSETFWTLYPFVLLLKKKRERILDLCCGIGHSSFVLSKYVKPQQLCCADKYFKFLYLAREYFAPEADFVCLDANSPLPFKEGTFSSVVMLDSFHALTERMLLLHELQRIIFSKGLLLLIHLHNSLGKNYGTRALYSMTPKAWVGLFKGGTLQAKAIPDLKILENFIFLNKLDLTEQYSADTLDSSNSITVLATSDSSVFQVNENTELDFLGRKDNLVINPIYEIAEKGSNLVLKRPRGIAGFGDCLTFSEKYLPERYEVPRKLFNRRRVIIPDLRIVEDLMKKFIIVDVPERYI